MSVPRRPSTARPGLDGRGDARRPRKGAASGPSRATTRPPAREAEHPSRPRLPAAGPRKADHDEPARRGANPTGRAAVLALVVCMLAISLAYPLREYLSQRAEIGDVRTQVRAQERRAAQLEAARARWRDPAYVTAQARERLHFVMPGEKQYVVLEPDEAPAPRSAVDTAVARPGRERPWFTDLWHSVEVAGTS